MAIEVTDAVAAHAFIRRLDRPLGVQWEMEQGRPVGMAVTGVVG